MTEKPNCGNCIRLEISELDDSCPNEEMCGISGCTITPEVKSWVEIHGCLSHPGAREYLMADVIKELEEIDRLVPHPQYLHLDLSESLAYIPALNCVRIHKIIALIRDGGK